MILGDELVIGEKIRLAPITRESFTPFVAWFNSELLTLRLLTDDIAYPPTQKDQDELFDRLNEAKGKDLFIFSIRRKEDDQLLGNCSLFNFDWATRCCDLGILIGDPAEQGKGYGTDAVRVLVRYGFMEINLNRIGLNVFDYNARAIRAYEKAGFVKEGALRQAVIRDGKTFDIIPMSILRREWEAAYRRTT